jgi:outer membrane protein TolC
VLHGNLAQQWDEFNIFLGLPVGTPIQLDPAEFEKLRKDQPLLDAILEAEAIEHALAARLDYQNQLEQVVDSERRTRIAANALLPFLDVRVGYDSVSTPGVVLDHSIDFDLVSAAVQYDFAIDRRAERNAYRASLIALQAAQRNADLEADRITANVREAIRNAKNARASYVIQTNAAELAARRVDSTRLNFDAGRAITRDVLEAQQALVDAQNTATTALIAFELSLLDLGLQIEALRVDASGIYFDQDLIPELTGTEP